MQQSVSCEEKGQSLEKLILGVEAVEHVPQPDGVHRRGRAACCALTADALTQMMAVAGSTPAPAVNRQLARRLVLLLQQHVRLQPCGVLPELSWDGRLNAYTAGRRAADCPGTALTTDEQPMPPILQLWLDVLSVVACRNRRAARELHSAGLAETLQQVVRDFRADTGVALAAQTLWASLALGCQAAMDEAAMEGHVACLLGLARAALTVPASDNSSDGSQQQLHPRQVQAAARGLEQLALVAYTCDAHSFACIIQPGGLLGQAHKLLTWPGPVGVRPYTSSVREGACQLVLECLRRVRKTEGLTPSQAPRVGWFASLSPRDLLAWERELEQPSAHAIGSAGSQQSPVAAQQAAPPPASVLGAGVSSTPRDTGAQPLPSATAESVTPTQACEAPRDDSDGGDGVREVYSSGPTREQRAVRRAWLDVELGDKLKWTQTSDALNVWLDLPTGTQARDVRVVVAHQRLTVSLHWAGRVLDGPLTRHVKPGDTVWVVETDAASCQLHVQLVKGSVHYWRSLFKGGPERSHLEVLKEAVEADEPLQSEDRLEPDARELLEELRDRQWAYSNGLMDFARSFDDYRLAVGDGML